MNIITLIIITILLFAIAGMFKAGMDIMQFKYDNSIFYNLPQKYQFWFNPAISWKNKYKNGDSEQGEKFFGSSTVFVWITDA